MSIVARVMFGLVDWAARKGLRPADVPPSADGAKQQARRTGVRGETYAYWYLRRQGYIMIARNFTSRGTKGEIDLVGYDGPTMAFVEVKTRTSSSRDFGSPEQAVTPEKRVTYPAWPVSFSAIFTLKTRRSDSTSWRLKRRRDAVQSSVCTKAHSLLDWNHRGSRLDSILKSGVEYASAVVPNF